MHKNQHLLIIIAGPNGAGKTTFVQKTYGDLVEQGYFLNADEIARKKNVDTTPDLAIVAGRIFLKQLDLRINSRKTTIVETTLSGNTLKKSIEIAKEKGFLVRLIYLFMDSWELCDFRVKNRVASGGHNIPLTDIIRRYKRSLDNLPTYIDLVHEFELFKSDTTPQLIGIRSSQQKFTVTDKDLWEKISQKLQIIQ
jgi:predicted ABC-type ATPase